MNELTNLSTNEKILIFSLLGLVLVQALWIFNDAAKRGENKWAWGLFGLINLPSSLIIYLIITRKYTHKIICTKCLYKINKNSKYCSFCGHKVEKE